MITLMRDGIVMEVATELQASVFLRSGYKRVDEAPEQKPTPQDSPSENDEKTDEDPFAQFMNEPETTVEPVSPVKAPKRRRRRKTE